ncbi:hypothetical protein GA0061078_0539 [Bifidobacterium bohemicum]|uniref:Uncharacterized protein n=1 Tax=Bifidobacterium bohemicum DSM 22767 TaxID=1437606 RepID=A0A086ZJT6_9BIFI|nr:hypothetical protein BBOH_0258 [Bifidobacterium bohemicum DSM 22767]SCB81441.1 hypothetical protein GA0061078_0539 [Bifidobacterium bohemicum]
MKPHSFCSYDMKTWSIKLCSGLEQAFVHPVGAGMETEARLTDMTNDKRCE